MTKYKSGQQVQYRRASFDEWHIGIYLTPRIGIEGHVVQSLALNVVTVGDEDIREIPKVDEVWVMLYSFKSTPGSYYANVHKSRDDGIDYGLSVGATVHNLFRVEVTHD